MNIEQPDHHLAQRNIKNKEPNVVSISNDSQNPSVVDNNELETNNEIKETKNDSSSKSEDFVKVNF